MGKRYHCDYCDKTMVAAPTIVKTHNRGVVHQKLVQEHYQQYKDPETILAEETTKKPCSRFTAGNCKFGGICRYSHYTKEELDVLREQVAVKNQKNIDMPQPSFEDLYQRLKDEISSRNPIITDGENTTVYGSDGVTHVFPWTYNDILDNYGDALPPSIKRLKIEDFVNADITEWG